MNKKKSFVQNPVGVSHYFDRSSSINNRYINNNLRSRIMEISPRKSSKRTQEHVDEWLQSQGYFRKHIPRDPTCLFRAVSEQVYLTQYYHIRVRKECVEFMRREKHLFEEFISIPYDNYLEQMACFTESGGMNEIQAMSLLYKKDVILFNGQKQTCTSITNNGFTNYIYLCHTPPKQYESVYTKNFVMAAGFCQSIIYQTLYKNVFDMSNVDSTVHNMLHDRHSTLRHDKFFLKGNLEIREQLTSEVYKRIENNYDIAGDIQCLPKGLPPFPYRVAKALDNNIYRNIDFDVWHEIRREIKNAGWTRYNSNGLQIGDKCLIEMNCDKNDLDSTNNNASAIDGNQSSDEIKTLQKQSDEEPVIFCGHIQEINKNEDSVVVFIEELGEKKTVPYSSLKPLSFQKNKQNSWAPICRKNVQFIEPNQKGRKPSNMSTNKAKELINRMNTVTVDNTQRGHNNNKNSITTDNTCIANSNNVIAPLSTVNTVASVTAVTNNTKGNNNINIKREEFQDRRWKGQSCRDNKCQTLGDNTLEKSSNYTTNNTVPPFQGGIHENKTKDSKEDGNSYPAVVPYVPGYVGELIPATQMNRTLQYPNNSPQKCMDLNGCDLPLSDPATLKFFYNLGLEYFRVNHAWNYGTNGQSVSPESWCITIPATDSPNLNTSPNIEEIHNTGTCMVENNTLIDHKKPTEKSAINTSVQQLVPKPIDICVNNTTDMRKDKSQKMENEKNIPLFAHENIKDIENVNKDKQRASNLAPRFKKDRHNNCEKMYLHQNNLPKQHQNNSTFCEFPNVQNLQNGDTQVSHVNAYPNQVHVPPEMPNSCHVPYVQQPPYTNISYCENEIETYGTSYYMSQGGFPTVTCMPNSDVVDASNVHSFLPCFYPSAETYPPAYPAVYYPQQTTYAGLPPPNMHESWYTVPEQHYYLQYGPVPIRMAEVSNEIGQNNNSNSST
ncbi:hypothetical protein KPH14_006692 [Odynerus spinipes]|uniref:OTU domain-containing protein n=1 Tax=Odynerus spinipes TaxID=1348599 RepID=A0AAD9RR12_9HYME|nr:hypothetical protein KPH14_006692 [Odynerus spinipes]